MTANANKEQIKTRARRLKITTLVGEEIHSKKDVVPEVRLIRKKVKEQDIEDYSRALKGRKNNNFSLNDFLSKKKESQKSKNKSLVIADLSGMTIGNSNSNQLFDLKWANFTNSIFHNTSFIGCDLKNARFANTDLGNAFFKESDINFVDFRHSDLSKCNFDKSYKNSPWNRLQGIKLSSTSSCIRIYADIKNEIAKKNEQQRLIDNKRMHYDEIKGRTSVAVLVKSYVGLLDKEHEYARAKEQYKKMLEGQFNNDLIVDDSFENIINQDEFIFDPVFLKIENYDDSKVRKKYFALTKENLLEYLSLLKKTKNLPLNNFAKELYKASLVKEGKFDPSLNIIADLSSKVNMFGNNEWNRMDLSEVDFTGADISEVNFSGTNLTNCKFKGANLSNSNFECALLNGSILKNIKADNANFQNVDFGNCIIDKSIFMRCNFSWSKFTSVSIMDVIISRARAKRVYFRGAKCDRFTINNSDFSEVDFNGVGFFKLQAFESIFNHSVFNNTKFDFCDIKSSILNSITAVHTLWDNSVVSKSEIRRSNLTGSKFTECNKFDGVDFSYSILDGIKAPRGHFAGAIFDHVKAGYAKFVDSNFENASLKFSDLNSCLFSQSNCQKANFTGAKLFNVGLAGANLKGTTFVGALLDDVDMTKADLHDANWQDLHLRNAVLDKVKNHRIKINNNTEFSDCSYGELDGQFYHYDEDNFMDIMFIEQLENNFKKIQQAEKIRKLGILSYFFKIFFASYRIPQRELRKLYHYRVQTKYALKKYLKSVLANEKNSSDIRLLNLHNIFIEHKK